MGDEPTHEAVGSWKTVPGVLRSLGVEEKGKDEQREAVRRLWGIPTTRSLLAPLEKNLRRAGLL
jgi:hypothetical protein